MINQLRNLNLLLVLPDDRVLLKRDLYKWGTSSCIPWSATIEGYLGNSRAPLVEVHHILRNQFKVNFSLSNEDKSVSVKVFETVSMVGKEVIPVVAKINTQLSFQAGVIEEFRAMFFDELLDEITEFSIKPKAGKFPVHTQTCIHVAKAIYEKGVFS